jgi:uncharacterized protein (DUF1697 family)
VSGRRRRYVALVRGINVGGRNKVSMADLRGALEDAGYESVGTYIQSGNVIFESGDARGGLESDIERVLADELSVPTVVVVRSLAELRGVIDSAPDGFGAKADTFHSDVLFLKRPLTAATAMRVLERRDGVDEAWAGKGVVYFARLSAERTKSRLSRITARPEYRQMTIRSWSTATKLLTLLERTDSA